MKLLKNLFKQILLCCLIIFCFLVKCFSPSLVKGQEIYNPRVLFVTLNPVENGQNLVEYYYSGLLQGMTVTQWEDYWANRFIDGFKRLSGNTINYQVVKKLNITTFPRFSNGYVYDFAKYRACAEGRSECEAQKAYFDNVVWAQDNRICELANENNVDEIWWMTIHGLGNYESFMIGPNEGFWINGRSYTVPACQKHYAVVVPNYTATGFWLHAWGHKLESNMDYLTQNWKDSDKQAYWTNFSAVERYGLPDGTYERIYCGNVEFASNAVAHYDDANRTYKNSSCIDWKNFPNFTGATQYINCEAWGCNDWSWQEFWFGSLPRADGTVTLTGKNGQIMNFKKNWWYYLLYPENSIVFVRNLPQPTATPVLPTPTPTIEGQATTIFQQGTNDYSGATDNFIRQDTPASNYCNLDLFKVGYYQKYAGLLRFDLSSVSPGAVVENAKLRIYANGWSGNNITLGLFKILKNWDVCTSNWNISGNGILWESGGCNGTTDRETSPRVTLTTSGISTWYEFNLSSFVQEWVNNPDSNKGILLRQTASSSNTVNFASSNNSIATNRPKLTITYRTGEFLPTSTPTIVIPSPTSTRSPTPIPTSTLPTSTHTPIPTRTSTPTSPPVGCPFVPTITSLQSPSVEGYDNIGVYWTDAGGETSYVIQKCTDGVNFRNITSLGANITNYTDTEATACGTYYYRVWASKSGCPNVVSNVQSIVQTINDPSNIIGTKEGNNINLTWTDNSNIENYFSFQRQTNSGANWSSWIVMPSGVMENVTSWMDSNICAGAKPPQQVRYRVQCSRIAASCSSNYVTSNIVNCVGPTSTPVPTATPTHIPTPTQNISSPTPSPSSIPTLPPGTEHTIVFQQAVDNYTGAFDTHIYLYDNGLNYCNSGTIKVGYKQQYASLIRFDLSSIPQGAVIKNTKLSLYAYIWSGANLSIDIFKVLKSWNPCQANWSKATNGSNWEQTGANGTTDRENTPLSSVYTDGISTWYDFDITRAVQDWVTNSESNKGLLLRQSLNIDRSFNFMSSDSYTTGKQPKLTVTYQGQNPEPAANPTLNPPASETNCSNDDPGNLNCDSNGLINSDDLSILTNQWAPLGATFVPEQENPDLLPDGRIDEADLTILFNNWRP